MVTFFAQAKKVTRSPAGRVEALDLKREAQSKELESRLRRNDEPKKERYLPAAGEWKRCAFRR